MNSLATLDFSGPAIFSELEALPDTILDTLDFGVIGIDAQGIVRRYNRHEAMNAGVSMERILGNPLFTSVAPCMNNFMVAQRLEDAAAEGSSLDATIDYVLTLRMRPIKVKLRLLAGVGSPFRYVLVRRLS